MGTAKEKLHLSKEKLHLSKGAKHSRAQGEKYLMNNSVDNALEDLWNANIENFPFKGYINPARKSAYLAMPKMLAAHAPNNPKILDFGCGPLDKTFMFKSLTNDLHAFDTLEDIWHTVHNNDEKIKQYARDSDIAFIAKFEDIQNQKYDIIMLHDVIEHFHMSPRNLLNNLLGNLNTGGRLVLTVPNAGNLRKRIHVLLGKTNYPRYDYFYWYPGKWDGHVREYVRGDLISLVQFLGLRIRELKTFHIHLDVLPPSMRPVWSAVSKIMPNTRDSFYLIAEKPENWSPKLSPTREEFETAFGRQYFSRLIDYEKTSWE